MSATGLTAVANDDLVLVTGVECGGSADTFTYTQPTGFANAGQAYGNVTFAPLIVFADKLSVSAGATGTLSHTLSDTGGESGGYGSYLISIAASAATGYTPFTQKLVFVNDNSEVDSMIDVEMFDELARPSSTTYVGERPPMLEEIFARVVRDGWAPRNPCTDERELACLETSLVRGDCIYPLVQEGDLIYIDPDMRAQSGDIVSFTLGKRGADAQNSELPPGQSQWAAGSRWCKLMAEYRGFGPMLLDRHGNSATATFLTCESPDAIPILHPVRNIMRNGKLLFPPATFSSEIGFNAATDPISTTIAGPVSVEASTGTPTVVGTLNVPAYPWATTQILTAAGSVDLKNNTSAELASIELYFRTNGGSLTDHRISAQVNTNFVPVGTEVQGMFSMEKTISVAADTAQTYDFLGYALQGGTDIGTVSGVMLKVEVIKR